MNRSRIVIFTLLILTVGSFLSAEESAGPKIYAKELQFDFGKVRQGSEVSHVFEVLNKGTQQLVIERVVPS